MAALRRAVLALAGAASGGAFSTSATYCYDNDPFPEDCWANKPTTTVLCTETSGTTTCKCADQSDNACNIPLTSDGATGRCSELLVYVGGEHAEVSTSSAGVLVGVSATSKEIFCKSMVLNDQWDELGLIATTPEKKPKEPWGWFGWLFCPDGYTASWWYVLRDTMCHRKQRFLGETCRQPWFSVGKCQGSDTSYDEYSTSCYQGTCVPYADARARAECDCSLFGANLFVVCSASNDACDGHACVWNTGDGNRYCDYATSQNWQTIFSR